MPVGFGVDASVGASEVQCSDTKGARTKFLKKPSKAKNFASLIQWLLVFRSQTL